ncbi:hypothetical protein ALC62_09317 [Cyphomyrmex costatus]|uniref:Uncharacterized protein n=1 Tax=Cyphomyrmex costatus TaxID=456900 RepID=A0A195CFX2_9HYME|nr:hypothetical protein ALC62_09317 [Cyphomyrmex costatus]
MSAAYASRFETVFLCTHLKGPKMSYAAAGRYMKKSKGFVKKWVKNYKTIKIFEKNPGYLLRRAKNLLLKKSIDVSLNTIRLLDSEYGWQSTKKQPVGSC